MVIFAIGQTNDDLSYLTEAGVELTERGNLKYDRRTLQTTRAGVFVAGEVATGPGLAVDAMASGQKTAQAVKCYLDGVPFDAEFVDRYEVLDSRMTALLKVKRIDRLAVPWWTQTKAKLERWWSRV